MDLLIKNVRVICENSAHDGNTVDIYIKDGLIKSIGTSSITTAEVIIEESNLCVSVGWLDIFAHFSDPGYEHKETLETGAQAAAAGGFTDVFVCPNTKPVLDNKSQIAYVINKSKNLPVNIYPLGAVSKNLEGKELAELYDMAQAGAIAFTDGLKPIQSAGLLLKALQYIKSINATIIQLPADESLTQKGLMNEGWVSTQLGLPGLPSLAEEIMIARDIELLKYTESKLHITSISTKKSLILIKKAKEDGLQISCSVTPYHLHFCDEDLMNYDTNLKLNPPLRTREDMMALREAFYNNEIDTIASHHIPQHSDSKICEFEYAGFGMIGLETLFPIALQYSQNIEGLITQLTINNRKLFNLPLPIIEENAPACLTLFTLQSEYVYDQKNIKSKSKNSAFINSTLKGEVIGIINKNHLILKNEN